MPNDALAFGYRTVATWTGATCERREWYWVCDGGDAWVTGFGKATTVGDTIVADVPLEEGSDALFHELAHVVQYKAFGIRFLPTWLQGQLFSALAGHPGGECNPMEISADQMAGTSEYKPCTPWWS